ncbi:MAG: FAD-dependent oxidoreductase, partial [Tateyamaria sp.]|nr:FAD-dependent oxidoreductase [Tateyamaria sp.]
MPSFETDNLDYLGLTALRERLKSDLNSLLYPGKNWVPPRNGVTDTVIIGGGMCGMVV